MRSAMVRRGGGLGAGSLGGRGGERGAGGVEVLGVDVTLDAGDLRQGRGEGAVGGVGDFLLGTCCSRAVISSAVRMPSRRRRICILAMGSRRASASRSEAAR